MGLFRLRLILSLIAGITVVSVASTYFEVIAHKLALRRELERRTSWLGTSLEVDIEQAMAPGTANNIAATVAKLQKTNETLGLAVFNPEGRLLASAGDGDVIKEMPSGPVEKAVNQGAETRAFGHDSSRQWLEDAIPLADGGGLNGVLVVLEDAGNIRAEGNAVWQRSFWRVVAIVLLIVGVTVLMIRWFLMRPLARAVDRLRKLRMGHFEGLSDEGHSELSLFTPLAREVETMAESLAAARASAAAEARLRDAGEHQWTSERLAVHMRDRTGSSRIFVVSNREPYIHTRRGRATVCEVPASGLVTAVEPVLRACDGVWVAHGSGNADGETVDNFDRLRVPPEEPRYSLRRVWMSNEEEQGYYFGFSNEGLWPLCHIAHTRPIFRATDWESYRRVNERFAAAVLEEMDGSPNPIVFVQDYHLALVPRLVKAVRPDARVAIFWHIPWPNPEAFGICPWQGELLDGLLGADLIGFHIPLHCNNFLSTVDRVLESRTDREHMTAMRHGHSSAVRPYPVSVVMESAKPRLVVAGRPSPAFTRQELMVEYGVRCDYLAVGVDRLDYTKGIVERLLAVEQLFEEHPWHLQRLTMVQIAAPSRSRIPAYAELRDQVEKTVERINQRFQTASWKPIVLISRQCSHQEVNQWFRAADVCLVTSLHDGMNLVAKEFVAARDDGDGVLVLSKFTGAAVELNDALLVNPYDVHEVGEAIHRALEMGQAERRIRMDRMRRQVTDHNVYRWAASILGDLRELRIEDLDTAHLEAAEAAQGSARALSA
jgi:trehalose 6-phosphate synthase